MPSVFRNGLDEAMGVCGNGKDPVHVFGTDLLPEPVAFGMAMRKHLDEYGDNYEQVLRVSAEIAHNLEALKTAVAFVRRQAMLDAYLEMGNGAAVGRLAFAQHPKPLRFAQHPKPLRSPARSPRAARCSTAP